MQKLAAIILTFIVLCHEALALDSGDAYMQRFQAYRQWTENLPANPDPAFFEFIGGDTPLSVRLRNKWLYYLASEKRWQQFDTWYRPGNDESLRCFAARAKLETGQMDAALAQARTLWLNGNSLPMACNTLFERLMAQKQIDNTLITDRIILALRERNLPLARYLLTRLTPPRNADAKLLFTLYQSPAKITTLPKNQLNSAFYLYGLMRLATLDMDKAIALWKTPKTQSMLDQDQKQTFLVHLTLYRLMRGNPDAERWFSRINPRWYNDTLLGWKIRHALKNRRWKQVLEGIDKLADKDQDSWQYWRARALEALGQKEAANALFQNLSRQRNYYGFMASLRAKVPLHFNNEPAVTDLRRLKPYSEVTDTIRTLYLSNRQLDAARLLNEFTSELPEQDLSALTWWLSKSLQWHARAVYLSSSSEPLKNQLALRFPLAWQEEVTRYAKKSGLNPEFVYAVIRQESAFNQDIVSSAGAIGLMQIMPQTGRLVAKRERIPFSGEKPLNSPVNNIRIGVAYLEELSRRFHHHPILMAAAYNAGPRQVRHWIANHPANTMDIWIETLPWQETRNYLKNIIAFYAVYQYRMKQSPDLQHFLKPVHVLKS